MNKIIDVLNLKEDDRTGISIFKLEPGSMVRGIDKVFGLPEGADISGTTADSIWAIEALLNLLYKDNIDKIDTNVLLLPIAAIVSGYHHTILECALALNINGYGQYAPGFYTTLQTDEMRKTNSGKEISAILSKYESKSTNRHLIIYQSTEGEKAFQTTREEDANLKEFIKSKIKLYKYWNHHFGELETFNKDVILKLMKSSMLDLG